MLRQLLNPRQPILGLDIGFERLKLVQLHKGKIPVLHGAVSYPLPERIIEKDGFRDKGETAKIIKDVCEKATPNKITAKRIVSALPETFVFSKTIQIPKMPEDEYAEAVSSEVAQFIPFPIDEVYLDYQPMITHPDESLTDLLVVATPKRLVNEFVEVAHLAGFELVVLETKPLAVGRALIPPGATNGCMIIEIGTEVTRISIWDGTKIRLNTTVGLGKNQITNPSDVQLNNERSWREDSVTPLIEEIISAARYHQNRDYQAKPIEKIMLCGSGSVMPGLDKYINEKTTLETTISKPKIQSKIELGPEFVVSFGLALRNEYE